MSLDQDTCQFETMKQIRGLDRFESDRAEPIKSEGTYELVRKCQYFFRDNAITVFAQKAEELVQYIQTFEFHLIVSAAFRDR